MWNRAPDMIPLPHFAKHDSRNLTAARARLAELLRNDDAERRMVTPPEELPSWQWFNPRRRTVDRCLTHEVLGDPGHARSALGGWEPRGDLVDGEDDSTVEGKAATQWGLRGGDGYRVPGGKWRPVPPAVAKAIATVHGCRFPIGEIHARDFHFCNEERCAGSSYCAQHAMICRASR